jgi:RNA recognition motif-containing protein
MKNIFVGNMDFGVTEEQLRAAFATYGQVDKVTIVTDRDSGQPRGFGFVEMSDDAAAQAAIAALNGSQLGGRNLNVNEARPKVERGGGDRGGGGGFKKKGGFGGRGGGGNRRY